MDALVKELKNTIAGDVHFDILSKKIYSVDASIFEVEPTGIIIPKDQDDLILAVQIAAEHGISLTPRGAGTSITGSCLSHGLIIDTSKYLNRILEINIDQEYAICEPGVVQDRLNEALSPSGYRLGPDTSTGNRATLGGMLGNNSAGARSLRYGKMLDHVDQVDLVLADGNIMTCQSLDEDAWNQKCLLSSSEGHIYREVTRILNQYGHAIETHFPKIPRLASGYNLHALLNSSLKNLCKVITGSEGTLGIAAKMKVKIVKKPLHTGLCVIHVADMLQSLHAIPEILSHHPLALEMIDDKILKMGRLSPTVRHKLYWLKGDPQAVFVAEFDGDTPQIVREKLHHFASAMQSRHLGYAHVIIDDPQEMSYVWDVRKAGLGLLLSKRTYNRAIAFIEDISIAPQNLPSFLKQFCDYLKSVGKEAGIYGHIGSGCIHIRPYIDLRKKEDHTLLKEIMDHVSDIVLAHGGAMSGEHGDGLIRSWLNEKMFGKEVYQAFNELKSAFDPHHLMNPGKIFDESTPLVNLRLNPETPSVKIPTFLDFTEDGGFELAADLCNGNGQCRKKENVMCPSFQATGDEYDTTRARAQSLRSIIHGKLPIDAFTGEALHQVMDLCLECKGCKRECPSQVDMAKMKTEFLFQYQEKHGYSLRNQLFGYLHTLLRTASPFAALFNALSQSRLGKSLMMSIGITDKRPFPQLAKKRFSSWFNKQKQKPQNKKVALFNDTYTEYNHPEIGIAAYEVLSKLGYEVILINHLCCGRPMISKGLLRQAQNNAENVVRTLFAYAKQEISIVGLEPSCTSALRDDFKGLIGLTHPLSKELETVIQQCISFDEFIHKQLPLPFSPKQQNVLVHGHCHQKALTGTTPTLEVLRSLYGDHVKEIESGCCGVAGSFGYEKEHYDISMKIGNLKLLPSVKEASKETIIVASGTSCRSQIEHGSERKALHLAEVLNQREFVKFIR